MKQNIYKPKPKSKLQQLFCIHKWVPEWHNVVRSYYDYSGFKVTEYYCHCAKCGKRKIRKYW